MIWERFRSKQRVWNRRFSCGMISRYQTSGKPRTAKMPVPGAFSGLSCGGERFRRESEGVRRILISRSGSCLNVGVRSALTLGRRVKGGKPLSGQGRSALVG